MKKLRITKKQASLLGLIKENEDSGIKSVNTALGDVIVRMVVYGDAVPKFKDRILQLIARQDSTATVGFFDATGKVVGNVKEIKLDSIKRDLKALDPTIMVEKKPMVKSLKVTQEQYDRLFASKVITESEVTGGLDRVDKSFKKETAGKVKEGEENEGDDQFKEEVIELIKYLYRKSEKLSPFWEQNGMNYDSICDTLLSKKLIVKNGGRYELAKALGNPQSAIQAVEDALRVHMKPQVEEPALETEASNLPLGAENDSDAPFNKKDDMTNPTKPKHAQLEPIAFNREIILFKSPDGAMYVFYHDNLDKNSLKDYASLTRHYVGKDEDGNPQYDYDEDFEIDADVVSNYVNDNLDSLSKGEGQDAYEQGTQLVKLDDGLKQELLQLYDKDKNLVKILNPIDEVEIPDAKADLTKTLNQHLTPPANPIPQSKIVAKLAELKAKEEARRKAEQDDIDATYSSGVEETTGAASAGAFTAPMGDIVKPEIAEPVVAEVTTVSSVGGQYDTPGLANVGRNGEFKKGPKTKAEKTTQWAGGSFVEKPSCTNCSGPQSLKTKKTGGSVNAPSLGENKIYETIAAKTGKTVDEVRAIIESKNTKA